MFNDDCDCDSRDCPVCERERHRLIDLILAAVEDGRVTEQEVLNTAFKVTRAADN